MTLPVVGLFSLLLLWKTTPVVDYLTQVMEPVVAIEYLKEMRGTYLIYPSNLAPMISRGRYMSLLVRGSTLDVRIILTSKVGPRTEKVNP